jgi:hypothetical protein
LLSVLHFNATVLRHGMMRARCSLRHVGNKYRREDTVIHEGREGRITE